MKKSFVSALCTALVAATALPAFALTVENAGFFRIRSNMANYPLRNSENASPDMFVDQRFRDKITLGVNDYIKIVYFCEIDFQYGDTSYEGNPGRNNGGAIGGDTVNLETKNLYVEAKIPNTPLTVTAGLQGYADNEDWAIINNDFAGFKFGWTGSNWAANAAWFKLIEESGANANSIGGSNNEDDVTLWAAQYSMTPSKLFKVGADFYYYKNQGAKGGDPVTVGILTSADGKTKEDVYWLAVNASYKLPMATISGWALYNWGKLKDVNPSTPMPSATVPVSYVQYYGEERDDIDISAMAATVKADFTPAPGMTAMARVLWFGKDSDATDTDMKFVRNPFLDSETAPFLRDGLMLMMPDAMGITYPAQTGYALRDAAYKGYGLLGFVANASYVPPTMKQLYVKGAFGYFRALTDDRKADFATRDGKNIGGELNGRIGYVFAEKFDVSLNAAYGFLGNFYNSTVNPANGNYVDYKLDDGDDPANPYTAYAMINVNF